MTNSIRVRTEEGPVKRAAGYKAEQLYSITYEAIGGNGVMPIAGWWGPYTPKNPELPNFVDEKYFAMLKDCGINLITVSPDDVDSHWDSVQKSLRICDSLNMGYFVYDRFLANPENIADMQQRISRYYGHKSCVGVHIFDEPLPDQYDNIGKVYDAYEKLNIADKHLYTNLYPVYGKTVFEKDFNIDYRGYVESYLQKVKTRFLSYDYYPFYFKGEGLKNANQYYYNLSVTRELANKYHMPLWVFVQAGGQWQCEGKPSIELYPSREEMLWNVNTNLAFGAKSIQYFTLIQPEVYMVTDTGLDFTRIGLIGGDGSKNIWYDYVKEINRHIAAIDDILMNSVNVGVIPVGKNAERDVTGNELITSGFRQLSNIVGEDLIVGCFDCEGCTALYVVNNTVAKKDTAQLTFDGNYRVEMTKNAQQSIFTAQSLEIELDPGEGVLLLLL